MSASPSARSKIFIRNVTVLDCALLDPTIGPRGRSWYVDITWSGRVDEDGVVFDFALAKKNAKATIDGLFDHRLLVPASATRPGVDGRLRVESGFRCPDGSMGAFSLDTYPQALAVLPDEAMEALLDEGDAIPLAREIARVIKEHSPETIEDVKVVLRENERIGAPHYFTYTHSLRNHFGNCQRFHGHSNVVEVFTAEGAFHAEASARAARLLEGRYLVSPEYVVPASGGVSSGRQAEPETAHIRYAGSQGRVELTLPRVALLLLPEESSIENISRYLARELTLPEGWEVHAYEGISKGAVAP